MLEALAQIVKTAAREEILPRFARSERSFKADGSIVTEADIAMQRRLSRDLAILAPNYTVLGEEMAEAEQAVSLAESAEGLWCLDPLDGTSNFAAGLPFFSVSLALLKNGKPVLGLVYDPIRDECFAAETGKGAYLDGRRLVLRPAPPLRQCIAVVDFKRLDSRLAGSLVSAPPYSSQRNLGSVALEWSWLAAGRYQVYLHGRQQLWDYAAGALILAEAGGCAETLAGEPIYPADLSLRPRSAIAAAENLLFCEWKTWLHEHA